MSILRNMASMLSATTGTGTLTLTTAASGFITFDNAGVPHGGVTVTYLIVDGTSREVGRGVYTFSGLTLTRVSVLASTNGGAKISCSGAQIVSITDAAEDHLWIDEAQVPALTAAQRGQLFANMGGTLYGGMLTPPVLANFTQIGSGMTCTQNSNANSVSISSPTTNGTDSFRGISIAAPATPYRVQTLIKPQMINVSGSFTSCQIGFYDGTKLHTLVLEANNANPLLKIYKYNSVSSFNASEGTNIAIGTVPDTIWFAVADDGTTVYFEYSYDGVNWVQRFSVSRASGFLGSSGYTNVCIGVNPDFNATTFTIGLVLFSYSVVAAAP